MSEHELCSPETAQASLVLVAREIVLWAGSLTEDGEEIGGIGAQLNRASRLLRLHYGVVWRAYQRRAGPEIFPSIWDARNALIERLAKDMQAKRRTLRLVGGSAPAGKPRPEGLAPVAKRPRRARNR